jgi:hypothetical protein
MPSFSPTQQAINTSLHQRLAEAGCRSGHLNISPTRQLSLAGDKPNGKTVFFWEFSQSFQGLIEQYLADNFPDGFAQVTVRVNVMATQFMYSVVTVQQQQAMDSVTQQQAILDKKNRRRDRTLFGAALAEQVAEALRQGRMLAHSHRDYCGMGLVYRANSFCYGEVWDGDYVAEPRLSFANQNAFVEWLAGQSDYSLAGLEVDDPWVWDNQTITRRRLEEFVAG